MANITQGMNVSEIQKLGNTLQQKYATEITGMITAIEKLVNSTTDTWVGNDANQFRSWWPQKRAALKAISDDLHGFGQSALNNAKDQDTISSK